MKNDMLVSKLGVVFLCAALVTACSSTPDKTPAEDNTSTETTEQSTDTSNVQQAGVKLSDLVTFDEDDAATTWSENQSTDIALKGASAIVEGDGAESKGGLVTITDAGTYVLSGKLSDGQIVVNNQDDGIVRLVLNGVDIHDNDSAAIYIQEAGKVVITLEEGTENTVSDGAEYVFADDGKDEPSAAIFSKADLTLNGTGKLSVTANYNDGIVSKDDLKIMSGTYEIQAADDGMVGKDMIAVKDGDFTINAEGDGVKSSNDEDADKGFIAIGDGTYNIKAGNDGIQAETSLVIDSGTYTMVTGGGNENGEVKMGGEPGPHKGMGGNRASEPGGQATESAATGTTEAATETESTSAKALKAGGDITVSTGDFTIDSADDAVHSNSSVTLMNGHFQIATGDDGIHANSMVAISGGTMDITKSYEGIEGANIAISGGEFHVVASDDGVNVNGGHDDTSTEGTPRQDKFESSGNNLLAISGGMLTVDAAGDGLDANGSIAMSGGTVIVNGPTNGGNGSLDFDGSFEQSGGTLIAAGSSGMAQAPSDNSSQHAISMTFPQTQQAGTLVHLEDSEGNTVLTFAPSKNYQSLVFSSADLKDGGSYTLYSGGTSTGSEANGLYTDGEYSGGTKVVSFEVSSSVTWLNESGVTTGKTNHGPGGGRGNRPTGKNPE